MVRYDGVIGKAVMKFSERYGYTPARNSIQLESMDDALRNSLWNALDTHYWRLQRVDRIEATIGLLPDFRHPELREICRHLWIDFFKWKVDTLTDFWEETKRDISIFFSACDWYDAYDLIEFVANVDTKPDRATAFRKTVNTYLERELSGYRFVNGSITPVTDQIEIEAIETAAAGKNQPVAEHLNRALELLSDREDPDYRNSSKESISAVESQVKSTLGLDRGTLGDLLNRLEEKEPLHPAWKEAFIKLYAYASDEGGIRHGLTENSREVTFDEAKFMLVTCSAFINYVRGVTKS